MLLRFTLILTLSLILLNLDLTGQTEVMGREPCVETYPKEEVAFLTDRDYYLTGETLWFKAFIFLNGKISSEWSKVLYVELYNDQKDVLIQNKYFVKEGMVDGMFRIPQDVNTGHYFLRCYTRFGLNFEVEKLDTKIISIINPGSETSYIETDEWPVEEERKAVNTGREIRSVPVTLLLSKDQYGKRERVDLKIESEKNACLAVTVRKKGTGHSVEELDQFSRSNPWIERGNFNSEEHLIFKDAGFQYDKVQSGLDWIPEMRGLSLTGKLINKATGKPQANAYCFTSVIGDQPQIHLDKTNEKGEFIFSFSDLMEEKDLSVSVINQQANEFEILINNDFCTSFPELKALQMPFDSSRHELFNELYINQQLNDLADAQIIQSAYPGQQSPPPYFNLSQADQQIELKDFISLPTMIEVFRELVPMVSLRGKIGNRKLNVFDREMLVNNADPLVLLDFVAVSNVENLLRVDPGQLRSIEIFYSDYILGDYTMGGIISIRTKKGDFAGFKWTDSSVFLNYKALQPETAFRLPVYSRPESKNNRKPDFRTLLYWNPKIQLKGESLTLSFYTSDHFSDYEVVVRGFTEEGKACYGNVEFGVRE